MYCKEERRVLVYLMIIIKGTVEEKKFFSPKTFVGVYNNSECFEEVFPCEK